MIPFRTLSRAIAREQPLVEIGAIAAPDGESEHVEIILTLHRPDRQPKTSVALVRRVDRETFERHIRRRSHTAPQSSHR